MPNASESFRNYLAARVLRESGAAHGSGQELVDRSGISRGVLRKWANGTSSPTLESLDALATATGIPLGEMLGLEPARDHFAENMARIADELAALQKLAPRPRPPLSANKQALIDHILTLRDDEAEAAATLLTNRKEPRPTVPTSCAPAVPLPGHKKLKQ